MVVNTISSYASITSPGYFSRFVHSSRAVVDEAEAIDGRCHLAPVAFTADQGPPSLALVVRFDTDGGAGADADGALTAVFRPPSGSTAGFSASASPNDVELCNRSIAPRPPPAGACTIIPRIPPAAPFSEERQQDQVLCDPSKPTCCAVGISPARLSCAHSAIPHGRLRGRGAPAPLSLRAGGGSRLPGPHLLRFER